MTEDRILILVLFFLAQIKSLQLFFVPGLVFGGSTDLKLLRTVLSVNLHSCGFHSTSAHYFHNYNANHVNVQVTRMRFSALM